MGAGKGLRLSRVRIEKQGEGRKQGQTPPARWGEQGRAGQGRAGQRAKNSAPQQRFLSEANEDNQFTWKQSLRGREVLGLQVGRSSGSPQQG